MQAVVIVGAGGSARDVLDVFDASNLDRPAFDVLGFVVDPEYGSAGAMLNDRPILGGFDWLEAQQGRVAAICAVGAPELRLRLVERVRAAGAAFCSVIHPSVVRTRYVSIGVGTVISAGCVLTNRIKVGNHVQVNVLCSIAHDVELKDFATLSPGVRLTGNVKVSRGSFIGSGAVVVETVNIGEWARLGAGTVALDDVPSNSTVVGVPGRVVRLREQGWQTS